MQRWFHWRAGGDRSVLDWRQPMLPPLPPGEAQRVQGWEVYGAAAKHPPQTAPGFRAAQRLGLLPPPAPVTPPQPLPGPSAHALLLTGIGLFFGTILLLVALPDDAPGVMVASLVIGGGGGALWTLLRLEAREREELERGYTSRPAYAGLWRLGRNGVVRREPDRDVPPPGFYPSPYQPGLLQCWDGPGWHPFARRWRRRPHQWLRWPEVPYLDGVPNRPEGGKSWAGASPE
ncbi:hypothetical protein IEZ26_13840 [Nocardioides cavernae]|uniref:DUF2510 domain-containing protein n=1 Tax=Nocardioides cavernae TaxID=1921566 RepID=A0ABR8NEX1_9ACTN|nr:hypothetical protein [Nocardioides cavernae]MBD3925710.1 hypothetical protein [Nocardioides cavernae]MBM7513295.1 hypothetical protein [Nocardioides cavernae]